MISGKVGATLPVEATPRSGAPEAPTGCEGGSLIDRLIGRWWVVYTRARNEKMVAACLTRMGVSHFLPLVRRGRPFRGRVRYVDLPLFPGYLFLCGDTRARYAALRTNRVAEILEVVDQEQLRGDLRQICLVLERGGTVDLYPGLRAGARCRVRSGPLAGIEGVVLRRRGVCRVYISVEFIGQSAELQIDAALLDVIDMPAASKAGSRGVLVRTTRA